MLVKKRDGRVERFNRGKVTNALKKAFKATDGKMTPISWQMVNKLTEKTYNHFKLHDTTVEEIQDYIEKKLMKSKRKDVAKNYIIYRNNRSIMRETSTDFMKRVMSKVNASEIENSNANVDEHSFSGREKEANTALGKYIALELNGLPTDIAKAHKDMLLYQHDLEKAVYGVHNCLFADIPELLKNGFTTRNGDVRPPKSYSSACQQIAVIFQCQSQNQFGGVASNHIDYDLAPFVRMSFFKHFAVGLRYLEDRYDALAYKDRLISHNISIDDIYIKTNHSKAYKYAMDMLEKEGKQATEALFHNLNTLESRQGSQLPFTSINLGRDTSFEGRLIIKWIMHASLNGIGKYHTTSIFPISIFQYKSGVNANKGDVNYDLKRLALKSMSKRIYPNWVNCDWSQAHENPNDYDTNMCTMGCRTLIGDDINGYGYSRQGRGNLTPNTMILPKLGIEYGICLGKRETPDLDGFWSAFEDLLKLCEKGLLARYNIIKAQSPKSAPFMYKNHTMRGSKDLKGKNTVEDAVKHGTLAMGYIGIAEMCQALFGKNHAESEEALNFAVKIVKRINEYAKEATKRNHLNFSCYATPAEGLCHTAVKALRQQYGVIENVTSRDYLTNSHHVPVWMKISIFDKLRIESQFTKYPTGGCITYVELDSTFMHNLDAVERIIDFAFKECDIPYLAFNFPINTCLNCGFQGEIGDTCPECGSTQIQHLARVTGYLSTDVSNFNAGKQAEVKDRVKHSAYTIGTIDLTKFKNKGKG